MKIAPRMFDAIVKLATEKPAVAQKLNFVLRTVIERVEAVWDRSTFELEFLEDDRYRINILADYTVEGEPQSVTLTATYQSESFTVGDNGEIVIIGEDLFAQTLALKKGEDMGPILANRTVLWWAHWFENQRRTH